ncbi:MAG TPA: ABC transporter substrate-binding protein [Thermoleophilia bacterium]|nr:ABC transporter substrate-binding protein [Thermoleophilia bacterium]
MAVKRTRHGGRLLVTLVVGLLAIGLLWGIAGAMASSESPAADGGKTILRLGWTNDPDNLNPFIGYESSSYEIWAINYELLVGFRASDFANVPGAGLATAWETSADGKVWTFTITDKSKWQDGEPLTASDVAFTFNYCIDNELGMFIDYVKFIDKVEAPDDTHVVFTCSKPKANMLGLWIPILPEHIWSKIDPAEVETKFQNPPPIIGSGPFQTVEWKKGEYVRMVANKEYWRGAPKVDEVIYQTYQNSDTMAQDLKTGAIQSGWNIPSAQFDPLNNEPDLESIRAVTIGFDQLGFNCADQKKFPKSTGHPVLQDPAFRTALQWAVDTDKIVSIGYSGNAAAADTLLTRDFYPPDADFHLTPEDPYTFDLEKAKAALDAAGYTDGDGNGIREYEGEDITLRLYARTESTESQNCGKLITGWFEEVGLDIDYEVIDDGALGDKQYAYDGDEFAPDFDLFIWGWGGDVDPNFILSIMTTDSIESWSDCNWSNAEYDQLFLEQQTTIDVQERIAIVHRMQQIVYDESPYILLVYPKDLLAANKGTWTGWVRANNDKGSWWYNTQPDTYLAVHPGSAEAAETDGGSSTGLIVGVVVAAAAVILIVVLLLRRRAGRVETEA